MRRQPLHPGVFFNRRIREELELSYAVSAKILGIEESDLVRFCQGEERCSPELACRLAMALDMNSAFWVNMQANYDNWCAEAGINRDNLEVEKFPKMPECA